jgi:hypothetical protein
MLAVTVIRYFLDSREDRFFLGDKISKLSAALVLFWYARDAKRKMKT